MSYQCECGRAFEKKFALTNHRNKCNIAKAKPDVAVNVKPKFLRSVDFNKLFCNATALFYDKYGWGLSIYELPKFDRDDKSWDTANPENCLPLDDKLIYALGVKMPPVTKNSDKFIWYIK